jgi:uncharacterized membrane protein
VLVYISLVERMAELVPDDGVLRAAPVDAWRDAARRIDLSVARGGVATATAVAALAGVLGPCMPCPPDDVNELPDDIDDRADDGVDGAE